MRFLDELEGLVSSQINVIKIGLSLTRMEARLAMLSVYPLIINICLMLVILSSTWLTLMGILGYGLMQLVDSIVLVASAILMFNILALGLLLRYLMLNLNSMSFEKTRAYLSRGRDELQKPCEEGNSQVEQTIGEPREPA